MVAAILDGRAISADVLASLHDRVARLVSRHIHPTMCFVAIGDSAPARMYLSRLQRLGARVGIGVESLSLDAGVSRESLQEEIARLNTASDVDGILIQMPLPDHLTLGDVSALVDPRKDVDGVTVLNAGKLYLGMPGHVPSTALAMICILEASGAQVKGAHAVVVGRSNVVGHPLSEILLHADATVTLVHRATKDLASLTRQADILMVGAGSPNLIRADMIKPGVVIVDAGINEVGTGIAGDVDFEGCRGIAAAITPVPGGVGPVTNAMILRNLVESAEQRIV